MKNINDSLINIEKNGQWVWFSSEDGLKSPSMKRNIDFEMSDIDKFSMNSSEIMETEAVNLNKLSTKLRVDKGLL